MEKYEEFFDFIKEILKKQQAQKLRGLNDYNMVNVVRNEYEEVNMHSNIIYSLLDPNGLHYQNDLFLNLFVEKVLGFELKKFGKIFKVQVEEQTDKNRRIDFTIKSENYLIGIEMKVNARDLKNQIFDYYEYLKEEADKKKVIIYYLTKDGKNASKSSKQDVEIRKISFKEHILNWIDSSQHEVQNITNLNVALEDYKNIVKKITNNYKGNVMRLADELKKNEEKYQLALEVNQELATMKEESVNNFFQNIKTNLENELGNEWEVKLDPSLNKSRESPLKIFKTQWSKYKARLIFGFEFVEKDYVEGTFGLLIHGIKKEKASKIAKNIDEKFKQKLEKLESKLDVNLNIDDNWVCWSYLPFDKEVKKDFVKYISFNKNAEAEFIQEVLKWIKIFEINSNLITDINAYLNENKD